MVILFQNTLFLKDFLACNGCFGLFSKIKKVSGASIWCTFSALFFYKNIPYLILYQWTKFQYHVLFLSQDIKQNVLLSSSLDSWDFSGSTSTKEMADRGKKRVRRQYKKFEYLENERKFLDEIKKIFHSFWRATPFFINSQKFKQLPWKSLIC